MNPIRTLASVAVILAAAAPSTGCAMDAGSGATPTASTSPAKPIDGEAAMRAIYAGEGDAASRLPLLWESAQPEGTAGAADEAISVLVAKNPEAAASFGADVTSGDVVRVRSALASMSKLLHTQAVALPDAKQIILDDAQVTFWVPYTIIWYPVVLPVSAKKAMPVWVGGGLSEDEVAEHIATELATAPK